jgi:CheY-like chemotaxis protein
MGSGSTFSTARTQPQAEAPRGAHVLVVDESRTERGVASILLQQASHRVDVAADSAAAKLVLERESPDVVLLAWSQAAPEIVRRIRACEVGKRTYVIAMLDKQPSAALPSVVRAGADDFIRRPCSREELLVRVDAPRRMALWTGAAGGAGSVDETAGLDLRKLGAFKNMGPVIGTDLKGIFGDLAISEGWQVSGALRGASIPMSVVSERAEIRVSVVVEAQALRALAGIVLGDEDASPAALDDLLREVANTAGGAVKRAAALEKVAITIGLPINEARGPTSTEMTRCWTARIVSNKAQLGIIGEIHRARNERIPVSKLEEGMVLIRDVRNDAGALVMAAGTRLTATTVTRMSGMLGERFVVEVTAG